jgi:dsRNA-specific ribonuclease
MQLMMIDAYRIHYHFRYTSLKEQQDIKQAQKQAKLSLFREAIDEPFKRITTSTYGLVDYRDGYSSHDVIALDHSRNITEFLMLHIHDTNSLCEELDVLIPEFVISRKPEWLVTCTLEKMKSWQASEEALIELQQICTRLQEIIGKQQTKLLLFPAVNVDWSNNNIEECLNFETIKHYLYKPATSESLFEQLNLYNSKLNNNANSITELTDAIHAYIDNPSATQSDEVKLMLEQADALSKHVLGMSVWPDTLSEPVIVECLEFMTQEPREKHCPIVKANYIEFEAQVKGREWFKCNTGVVSFQIKQQLSGNRRKESQPKQITRAHGIRFFPSECRYTTIDFSKLRKHIELQHKIVQHSVEQIQHYERLSQLHEICHINFKENPKYLRNLRQAFTHSAYAHQNELKDHCNELLEFIGDSILHLTTSTEIYKRLNGSDGTAFTGDWYELFMGFTQNKHLQQHTSKLGIQSCLLSPREMVVSPKMTADLYEALIGSVYHSFGFQKSLEFVRSNYLSESMDKYPLYVTKIQKDFSPDPNDIELKTNLLISYAKELEELQTNLGYKFNDVSLLLESIIHCSYNDSIIKMPVDKVAEEYHFKLQKMRKSSLTFTSDVSHIGDFNRLNSEKLRFLGIAIFKFFSIDYFQKNYPDSEPGHLTLCSQAVMDHNDACVQHGIKLLDLEKYVLHKYEKRRAWVAVLDCYLAVIAAVFVDYYNLHRDNSWTVPSSSLSSTITPEQLMERFMYEPLRTEKHIHPSNMKTPLKSHIQHLCHTIFGQETPVYDIVNLDSNDDDHSLLATYSVTIRIKDQIIATHSGTMKKPTEREACMKAIHHLQDLLKQ